MPTKTQEMEKAQLVGHEFVRLYYKVMNSYPHYLHLFYEEDSTVVISESQDDEKPTSIRASKRENVQKLLWWMYGEAHVSLLASVPQTSLNGSILLLNSGRIKKKAYNNEERFFTQALFLRRQDNGFYVKTDSVQVLSPKTSLAHKLLPMPGHSEDTVARKPLQLTGKARETKHQPNDSCFECHVDLSQLGGTSTPQSNRVSSIGAKTPKQKHDRDASAHMFLPEITEGTANAISGHGARVGRAERHDGAARRPPIVAAGNANTGIATAERPEPVSATRSFHGMDYAEPDTPAYHFQPPFTNRNDTEDTTGMPELTSLFAARLPLDVTPTAVGALFSEYGRLKANAPIRVFTGPTNCYACVSFESEADMRAALNSNIKYEGHDIITEIWRPRDRRGRRTGREYSSRADGCRPLYRRP